MHSPEHPSKSDGPERERIIRELAERLAFLRDDQREHYIELMRIPFRERSAEVDEMITKLIILGYGQPEESVDAFIDTMAIPFQERTPDQRKLIADTAWFLMLEEHPGGKPALNLAYSERFVEWANRNWQRTYVRNSPENMERLDHLYDDIDSIDDSNDDWWKHGGNAPY